MTDPAEDFLSTFDGNAYPAEFLTRYEPLECLGQNEEGETLYVRDRKSGGYAVSKCYRRLDLCSREDEGAILARLDHPGLPRYLGRYEDETVRCILREYAQGVPLSELSTPLPEEEALQIGAQLCDILTYLHSRTPPVIHRDIKPQNVVLQSDGQIKLIDFGISRSYNETAGPDTVCFGTREFAPPEQYGFAQTDPRTDVYSLGVLLRFLITGGAKKDAGIPNRRLEKTIDKCTAFAPEGRYQSAETAKRALLLTSRVQAGHRKHRVYVAVGLAAALVGGFYLGRATVSASIDAAPVPAQRNAVMMTSAGVPSPSGFTEPLIEQAARLSLGVKGNEVLTRAQLEGVRTIYIVGNSAFATEQEYNEFVGRIYNAGTPFPRGTIKNLNDVLLLPNLERVRVIGERLTDISALAKCSHLVDLELKHNDLTDLSPLKNLDRLENVIITDNPIADISPLYGKTSIRQFELCAAPNWDKTQVADLTDELDMLNVSSGGSFLDGKTIRELWIERSDVSSMEMLAGLHGLRSLYARGTPISDLAGIEIHQELERLDLSHTAVTDFTPLLKLPMLCELTVDEIQLPYTKALEGKFGLTILCTGF